MKLLRNLALAIYLLVSPAISQAHEMSFDECVWATDLIGTVFHDWENGVELIHITNKMEKVFVRTHELPVHQRWFIVDEQDEHFFRKWIIRIWDNTTQNIDQYMTDFLVDCLQQR